MKKRIISLLLVLCLIPFIPYTVSAETQSDNLALGKNYTLSGNGKGYGAYTASLTDGIASDDMYTLGNDDWLSFYYDLNFANPDRYNTENGCGIVTIDLEKVQQVGRVKIHLGNNFDAAVYDPYYASVSVSSDGINFIKIDYFDLKRIQNGYNYTIAYWTEVSFVPVEARYVRIQLKASTYHTFINEIEVYSDGKAQPNGKNLALNGNYTLSGNGEGYSVYTASLNDGIASKDVETLFNDDWLSFYYDVKFADPDRYNTENGYGIITFDLGGISQINSFRLHLGNNYSAAVYAPEEALVSVSIDGINYLDAGCFEVKPISENGENDNFAYWTDLDVNLTARYVKIYLKAAFYHTFVNEIEIYGEELPEIWKLGDIDGNGEIKAPDYLMLKRAVLGLNSLNANAKMRADIKEDGNLNATDYMMLKSAVLGNYQLDHSRFDNINFLNSIPRLSASEYKTEFFAFGNDEKVLKLLIPSEWIIEENGENGYNILRESCENCQIGSISDSFADLENWNLLSERHSEKNGLKITEYAEENDGEFRYRYTFTYGEKEITLTVNVTEINEKTAVNFLNSQLVTQSVPTQMGTLSHLQDGRILILGNSFLATSDIQSIYTEMAENNQKNPNVTAIFVGSSISLYLANESIMLDIKSGMYDAVFVSGFYHDSEIGMLQDFRTVCESYGVEVVIFPAHNEFQGVLDNAAIAHPDLHFLDWKGEIDMLIEQGVDKWDMCINDAHLHSTPLAGYVGAHLIYRAVYGEIPEADMVYTIEQSYIDSLLGDYADYGVMNYVQLDNVHTF